MEEQMQRNQIRDLVCGTAVSGLVLLSGCSSSSNPGTSSGMLSNILSVPGISSAVTYSFDLGVYDSATGKYYVTDRTNRSIDVLDVNNGLAVTQFKPAGLTGCAGTEYASPGATAVDNVAIPTCASTTGANAAGTNGVGVVYPMLFVQNDHGQPGGHGLGGPRSLRVRYGPRGDRQTLCQQRRQQRRSRLDGFARRNGWDSGNVSHSAHRGGQRPVHHARGCFPIRATRRRGGDWPV